MLSKAIEAFYTSAVGKTDLTVSNVVKNAFRM